DHGKQGIRVNCICPGDVETPMLPVDAKMRGLAWDKYLADCANRPLGRIGTVDEIAKAVLFLASDDSSFMTGAALVVDGGGTADYPPRFANRRERHSLSRRRQHYPRLDFRPATFEIQTAVARL